MIQKQLRLLRMLPLLALATVLALSCPRIVLAANTASTQVTLSVSGADAGGNGGQTSGSGNAGNNDSSFDSENAGNNPSASGSESSLSGTSSRSGSDQTHGPKTGDETYAEMLLFFGLALMSASVIFLLVGRKEMEKHFTSHKTL